MKEGFNFKKFFNLLKIEKYESSQVELKLLFRLRVFVLIFKDLGIKSVFWSVMYGSRFRDKGLVAFNMNFEFFLYFLYFGNIN